MEDFRNVNVDIKSVVDYGCGAGWFLYYFKKSGVVDLVGLEPNEEMVSVLNESIKNDIIFKSLTDEVILDRAFDLAMNIEVAEHIDEKHSDIIIENITRHTNLLVFSAAPPGQGGWGHINEQPFGYWESKLNRVGFYCDTHGTKKFQE